MTAVRMKPIKIQGEVFLRSRTKKIQARHPRRDPDEFNVMPFPAGLNCRCDYCVKERALEALKERGFDA